jgi:ubiquinone biosynthesis protein
MSVLQTVRNVQRLRHITAVLIKHGFGQVIEKLGLEYRIFVQKFGHNVPDTVPQPSIAERARMVLEELGPTFIKLGQVLSTRPDLIPAKFIHEFTKLQDQAPLISFQEISDQITLALGKSPEQIFSEFERVPIASASIGQVHKARLLGSNAEVVVKVQRPQIRAMIESDLDILYMLARLIENNIPETRVYSPVGMIEEFDRAIHRELNYMIEAQNMNHFRYNFRNDPTIYVPRFYQELSTKTTLVIEFLHGVKISELTCSAEEKKQIARIGFRSVLKQIFIDGFFHSDPHPGNLFVLDYNKLAFIDFGMMGRLDQEMKDELADLLVAVINQDVRQITDILSRLGVQTTPISMRDFRRDVGEILDHYYGMMLNQIELGAVTLEIVDVALKYHVRIPSDYTMMVKSLLTIEHIALQLDPTMNAVEEAKPMVTTILRNRWNPHRLIVDSVINLKNLSLAVKEFPAQVHHILEEIREGRLRIEFEHVHLDQLIATLHTASNRLAGSLVIAALIIGSSLIMQTNRGPFFMEFPVIGILGYLVAGILGLLLLVSIVRS